jgi:hypothetical protein
VSTATINPERQQALRWLVGRLRWEQWLDDVREGGSALTGRQQDAKAA